MTTELKIKTPRFFVRQHKFVWLIFFTALEEDLKLALQRESFNILHLMLYV